MVLKSYDNHFYLEMSESSNSSAQFLVPLLMQKLEFNSVIDIGCGDGQFVSEFIKHGITEIKGIEGNWILDSLDKTTAPWLELADLTEELILGSRFDLAICLEVSEHLEEQFSDNLIASLTRASDLIFFSAAIPGQGGTNHVNLQYPDYWARKFAKHNYYLEWDPREMLWGNKRVAPWYQQNCLLYKKSQSTHRNFPIPASLKHPEIFPELQSNYFKFRRLFFKVISKVKNSIFGIFK
jgi:SAM-dependent methyltransferase